MRWMLLAACLSLTLSCAEATSPDRLYRFSLVSLAFGEGDAVVGQLLNSTTEPLRYDLCQNAFQRRPAGGAWEPAGNLFSPPEEVACPGGMTTLEPGALVYFRHRVLAALPPAEYRVRTVVEVPGGQQRELVTQPFEVR
jgi:hypothetical protein